MSSSSQAGTLPAKLQRLRSRSSEVVLDEAATGLDLLLTGDFDRAVELMRSRPESPWHVLTLGVIAFLRAALGMQDADSSDATALLQRAEALASAPCAELEACDETGWWPARTSSRIIQADACVLQAMMCILSGSTWALWQCACKMNRTHRLCLRSYKEVFDGGVPEGSTVAQIVEHVEAIKWSEGSGDKAHWTDTLSIKYVVTAAAYGKGIFDLIFSLLPPSVKRLTNVFYTPGGREMALNLLLVASQHGSSIHSPFGSLAILTYHSLILQFTGWCRDCDGRLEQCDLVLGKALRQQPNSALWRLNELHALWALDRALHVLEHAIAARETHFPQAETVLCYELAWCQLAAGRYAACADTALHLATINTWGTETYLSLAFGSLKLISEPTPAQIDLMDELIEKRMPEALLVNRAMGKPTPSQNFVSRRLDAWLARLAASPTTAGPRLANVATLSPALELALHFNLFPCMARPILREHLGRFRTAETDDPGETASRYLLRGVIRAALGETPLDAGKDLQVALERGRRIIKGPYAHVRPLALLELATLALKTAQVAEDQNESQTSQLTTWLPALESADRRLDELLRLGHYDLHIRVELRAQALKGEIADKRAKLRLPTARL